MSEAVTDVIVARSQEAERLTGMVLWSVALHAAVVLAVLALPEPPPEAPRAVMTISLGGAVGPDAGGMTEAGGRAVQAPPPPEPVRRAEAPPAPTPPPMTVPTPEARPRPRPPQPKPEQAPPQAAGRTVSTGEEPRTGSTRAETGARGQGFGLSTGGGGIGGVRVSSDFCCPEYLEDMIRRIRGNWQQHHGLVGSTSMEFTILRDGTIQGVRVERSSGFAVLDQASQSALLRTQRLPPLPGEFTNPSLTVYVRFDYQR